MEINRSDLLKIHDAMAKARNYLVLRDENNAQMHMSDCRYSPLTSVVDAEYNRLQDMLWPDRNNTTEEHSDERE